MNLLFICNQNENRSKTAELLFKNRYNTKSAGLFNKNPVKEQDLSWADIIFVMEEHQRKELALRFPKLYLQKRILSLDIEDKFIFNENNLIRILHEKVNDYQDLLA